MEEKHTEYIASPNTPFDLFGVEVDDGWKPIAEKVLREIVAYNETAPEDSKIWVDQVKEKFATLRIYVTYDNVPQDVINRIDMLIEDAEKEAENTCEICGTKENIGLRTNGWYTVMCEDCARKIVREDKERGLPYKDGIKWKRKSDGKTFLVKENTKAEID